MHYQHFWRVTQRESLYSPLASFTINLENPGLVLHFEFTRDDTKLLPTSFLALLFAKLTTCCAFRGLFLPIYLPSTHISFHTSLGKGERAMEKWKKKQTPAYSFLNLSHLSRSFFLFKANKTGWYSFLISTLALSYWKPKLCLWGVVKVWSPPVSMLNSWLCPLHWKPLYCTSC